MTYIEDDVRVPLVELSIVVLGIRHRLKVLQLGERTVKVVRY